MKSTKGAGVFDMQHWSGFLEKANQFSRTHASYMGMVLGAVLALVSSGCITSYGDLREVPLKSHVFNPTGIPLSFNVKYDGKGDPYILKSSNKWRADLMRTILEETLREHDLFTKTTRVYLYQPTGLFCVVNIMELPFNSPSKFTRVLFWGSVGTLFILPFYGDQGGRVRHRVQTL